jgi:hypothetical protein
MDMFIKCTHVAHAKMKRMIAPRWKTGHKHQRLSQLPSALFAVDVGTKSEEEVTAQSRHSTGAPGARLNRVTSSSRLKVVFEDCEDLLAGLSALECMFAVAALENRFARPTPLGKRSIDLVVEVPIELPTGEHADRDCDDSELAPPIQTVFLVQIQLQLLRYEEAERDAAPHEQLFIERLPLVCRKLDPKDRQVVQVSGLY